MRVILQIVKGRFEGRQIPLRTGEIARFGRGGFADISFPDDAEMSDVHFELECRSDGCLLRNLSESGETRLNGQAVSESVFRNGDTISAGQTDFLARIEGEITGQEDNSSASRDGPSTDVPASAVNENPPKSAAEVCDQLELDEESQQLLLPDHSPTAFLDALISHEQYADAVRVLAYLLSKRQAVWWAYLCMHESSGEGSAPVDSAVLDTAVAWIKEPSEQHRRAAMSAAEASGYQSPASWVALAAFWSGGSIAPIESPEVLPDDRLTSQGVSAALLMSATQGDPDKSRENYRGFLNLGKEIFDGGRKLPDLHE